MIFGIGTDIVSIVRVAALLEKFADRFVRRILSEQELRDYQGVRHPAAFLAKRFAAKEAVTKALGTGFRNGLSFHQITIFHDVRGKPLVETMGATREMFVRHNISVCHLSLSDESDVAIAYVILEVTDS